MKRKKKAILLIIIVIFIFTTLILPSIKSSIYQSVNRVFVEDIEEDAIAANIKIVQIKHQGSGRVSSVSAGGSGVIFRRDGTRYYALTAEHVIKALEEVDQIQIMVIGHDQLDFNDYLSKGGKYQGIVNYYRQFPEARIEYANDKYDLAVISFDSNEDYAVLPISSKIPGFGDTVASMSNPHRRRNIVTTGKVSTIKPRPFGDQAGKMQYPIIKHTAMISEGSSGSALLNENLEIVAINLGGGENIFRKFVNGMAMPSDRIRAFLDEWGNGHP